MEINNNRKNELATLQNEINLNFSDLERLNQAFIHPSFTNEQNLDYSLNNQRLEFLGDAVLELVVSDYLFKNYPKLTEGQMTKLRALIVCEPSLYKAAKEMNLGRFLILGKGEENTGGSEKPSILADTFESLVGAIFIDKGLEAARNFILKSLEENIIKAVSGEIDTDYKTALQEILQKQSTEKILYKTVKEEGPDHDKVFYVELIWNGKVLGKGTGHSKKEAEQRAAKQAMSFINADKK